MPLFQPYAPRLSDWFAVAGDRSLWWAFEFGLTQDYLALDALKPGRLAGRVWPEASPVALYLACDVATWALLFQEHVQAPDFPVDALGPWSNRLVDAFVSGHVEPGDPWAAALANVRRRWSRASDESRIPAAAVELARFLDGVRIEARDAASEERVELPDALDIRGRTSALPLLLTVTPRNLAPELGLRETPFTRSLIRRASLVSAWAADIRKAEADGSAALPNLVARLAMNDTLGWDDAMRGARIRHDAECLMLVEAVEAAIDSPDADTAWLGRTLTEFVAGYGGWSTDRHEVELVEWRPSPFGVEEVIEL